MWTTFWTWGGVNESGLSKGTLHVCLRNYFCDTRLIPHSYWSVVLFTGWRHVFAWTVLKRDRQNLFPCEILCDCYHFLRLVRWDMIIYLEKFFFSLTPNLSWNRREIILHNRFNSRGMKFLNVGYNSTLIILCNVKVK